MNEEESRKLAEKHWEFLERWLHMVYVDALVHGFKHGTEAFRDTGMEISGEELKKIVRKK